MLTRHHRIVVSPTSTMKENPLQYRVRGTPVPTTRTRGTNYPESTPIDTDGARLLFQAIADAYEQRSLIITTNLAFSQWGQVFGNDDMAAAAIDRIVHHGRMITFTGQSYRMANALMK